MIIGWDTNGFDTQTYTSYGIPLNFTTGFKWTRQDLIFLWVFFFICSTKRRKLRIIILSMGILYALKSDNIIS